MILEGDSLSDLILRAWHGRRYILAGLVAGFVIALFLMLTLTPYYEARMIIAPPSQISDERSLTVLNGNPTSTRMTSVSSQISRDYTKFQQTFREVSAAKILAQYQGVLTEINKDRIFKFGASPAVKTPAELSDYIKQTVTSDPLGATTSLVLTYRHPDSAFAEKFLRHLHKITDEMIRNDTRVQTESRIAYLQKALQDAYNPDHRKALTDQLMVEERQRMMINMDQPFASEIVEPPASSSRPVWPKAGVIYPACLLVGAFLGFLIFIIKRKPAA